MKNILIAALLGGFFTGCVHPLKRSPGVMELRAELKALETRVEELEAFNALLESTPYDDIAELLFELKERQSPQGSY